MKIVVAFAQAFQIKDNITSIKFHLFFTVKQETVDNSRFNYTSWDVIHFTAISKIKIVLQEYHTKILVSITTYQYT